MRLPQLNPDRLRLLSDISTYIQELRSRFFDLDVLVENKLQILTALDEDTWSSLRDKIRKREEEIHNIEVNEKDTEATHTAGNKEKGAEIIATLLASAMFEARRGKTEKAFRELTKAKQMEILYIDDEDELIALGKKFYNESVKLSDNRKKTVEAITGYFKDEIIKNAGKTKMRKDVFTAAKIIGEHYDNEGFKVLIRTRSFKHFTLLLISLLVLIPLGVFFCFIFLSNGSRDGLYNSQNIKDIFSMEVLGMLGAVFSVIISYTRSPFQGTIPQQKLIFQVSLLRPFIGAASALTLYILFKAELIIGEGYEKALYALAFVSGFSERFIVSRLEGIVSAK